MSKLRRILKNPLTTILPLVIILLLAWQQHTTALTPINTPPSNILSNGNLEEWNGKGLPNGWQVISLSESTKATRRTGYESPSLLAVSITDKSRSATEITSPTTNVQGGTQYFYKGYYLSSVPFDLIMKTTYQDGSSHQTVVRRYDPSTAWTTATHLFSADNRTQSVQFIYSFAAAGELQIDHCYLEANPRNVYQTPKPNVTQNLLQNSTLATTDGATPEGWSSYTAGNQATNFGYVKDTSAPYLHTQMTNYKGGEAKWQYEPISIKPNHLLRFNVTYRSDTTAQVVAEYVRASGERQFQTITDLLPVKEWSDYSGTFETPADATNIMATVVQHANGTVDTKSYALYDITKPGETTWRQPILSYTFDDGWQSAYENAVSPLSQMGYKATFYLNPSSIDTPYFMNSENVSQLQSHGFEIASHGNEHLDFTALSQDAAEQQLEKAHQYFTQVHNMKTINFATPYGTNDPQLEYVARKYYTSLRGATSGINTKQNFDPYNLSIMYIGRDTPIAKLSAAITETKAKHGWLILVYHRVETATSGETTITPTQFQQQLAVVKQSGVDVKTVQAALQEVGRQ